MQHSVELKNPRLWRPPPTQQPNLYKIVTTVLSNGSPNDKYETRFGNKSLEYDPGKGLIVNGEHTYIKGDYKYYDLGALGAAFEKDLAFVTVQVSDEEGLTVPVADNLISFSIEGPGEIIATDNGDPADMTEFQSTERHAFNGLALRIIQSERGKKGDITVKVQSAGLEETTIQISSK